MIQIGVNNDKRLPDGEGKLNKEILRIINACHSNIIGLKSQRTSSSSNVYKEEKFRDKLKKCEGNS